MPSKLERLARWSHTSSDKGRGSLHFQQRCKHILRLSRQQGAVAEPSESQLITVPSEARPSPRTKRARTISHTERTTDRDEGAAAHFLFCLISAMTVAASCLTGTSTCRMRSESSIPPPQRCPEEQTGQFQGSSTLKHVASLSTLSTHRACQRS